MVASTLILLPQETCTIRQRRCGINAEAGQKVGKGGPVGGEGLRQSSRHGSFELDEAHLWAVRGDIQAPLLASLFCLAGDERSDVDRYAHTRGVRCFLVAAKHRPACNRCQAWG